MSVYNLAKDVGNILLNNERVNYRKQLLQFPVWEANLFLLVDNEYVSQ